MGGHHWAPQKKLEGNALTRFPSVMCVAITPAVHFHRALSASLRRWVSTSSVEPRLSSATPRHTRVLALDKAGRDVDAFGRRAGVVIYGRLDRPRRDDEARCPEN